MLAPRNGFRGPISEFADLSRLAGELAAGSGPIALDAERASGYRYSQRAYLVQLYRADIGNVLIDPIRFDDLRVLAEPLADAEWVLHAATQDLPCLAELGLRPRTLFDTELAGRLAGLPRVGLGPLVEQMLGLSLRKGHGADDWSRRPLPESLLVYAALDVDVLIDLRDAMERLLAELGRLDWARQEFAGIVAAPDPAPRIDPWRRTSGIHRIRDRRTLAAIRELWIERDRRAAERDIAPHRVLPDSAIVEAAQARPGTVAELVRLPVFGGRSQRRHAEVWLAALHRAAALPESDLPPLHLAHTGPPPAARWAGKDPLAHARLTAAKAGLAELGAQIGMPVENLMTPSLVRSVLWEPAPADQLPAQLRAGGARPWQVELVAPVLVAALDARPEPAADQPPR